MSLVFLRSKISKFFPSPFGRPGPRRTQGAPPSPMPPEAEEPGEQRRPREARKAARKEAREIIKWTSRSREPGLTPRSLCPCRPCPARRHCLPWATVPPPAPLEPGSPRKPLESSEFERWFPAPAIASAALPPSPKCHFSAPFGPLRPFCCLREAPRPRGRVGGRACLGPGATKSGGTWRKGHKAGLEDQRRRTHRHCCSRV